MDVTFNSWTRGRILITPHDSSSPPYEVNCHYLLSKLVFSSQGQELARSKLHCYKGGFNINLGAQDIKVSSDKFWKIQRSYNSPAFGQHLTWKTSTSFSKTEFVCLDEKDMPLARFTLNCGWSWKKIGTIEFEESKMLDQAQKDEIVVCGTTLAYQVIQNRQAASAASASSASSVAVAA